MESKNNGMNLNKSVLLLMSTLIFLMLTPGALAATAISTCQELQDMQLDLAGDYYLTDDINCSDTINWNGGQGFAPVGSQATIFSGKLDGQNHTISNLYINRAETDYVGLFGATDYVYSEIKNVGLENVNIVGRNVVGGLIGYKAGRTVSNCYSTGSVSGGSQVGGLVGENYITISNSYSTAIVSGNSYNAGGLVGKNWGGGIISNSYATGSVSGGSYVGGLVGQNYYGTITNSYATGAVSGSQVGGLVGYTPRWETISNSFWDINTSGQGCIITGYCDNPSCTEELDCVSSGYCENPSCTDQSSCYEECDSDWLIGCSSTWHVLPCYGKTTAEMKTQSTFSGWDFINTWTINEGNSYPYLQWQQVSCGLPACESLPGWGCGYTLTQSCEMTQDLKNSTGGSNCPGNGIIIGAADVTLDCAGHSMTGNSKKDFYGITGTAGTIVQNCVFSCYPNSFFWSIRNVYIARNNSFGSSTSCLVGAGIKNSQIVVNNTLYTSGPAIQDPPSYGLIANNTINSPGGYSIWIRNAQHVDVIDNKVASQGDIIILQDSSYINLINTKVLPCVSTVYAIKMQSSSNNNIINFTAQNKQSIGLLSSHNNTIINAVLTGENLQSPYNALLIFQSSSDNQVINSTITNPTTSSSRRTIYFENSENNMFYGNRINASKLVYFQGAVSRNSWNSSTMGNYWLNKTGGFSQTCSDANHDRICDNIYVINDSNIDYLPLRYSVDADSDTIPDSSDNCVNDYNPDQHDIDATEGGDVCDACPACAGAACCIEEYSDAENVDESGATIVIESDSVLDIPAEALIEDTSISITKGTGSNFKICMPESGECGITVSTYTIGPTGQTFNQDYTLKLSYGAVEECSWGACEIWYSDDNGATWSNPWGPPAIEDGFLVISANHFTEFAIVTVNRTYVQNITVTLTATDDEPGVAETGYCVDNVNECAPSITYTEPFVINEIGTHYVRYQSYDNAGNVEAIKIMRVNIIESCDSTPPIIEIITEGVMGNNNWFVSVVNWTIRAIDNISGIKSLNYSVEKQS